MSAESIFWEVVPVIPAVDAELFVGKVSECRPTGVSDASTTEELVNSSGDQFEFTCVIL
jgi:hypothetical protein